MIRYGKNKKVLYTGWDRKSRVGVLTGRGIKDGEKVFDVTLSGGEKHWGYVEQFRKYRRKGG